VYLNVGQATSAAWTGQPAIAALYALEALALPEVLRDGPDRCLGGVALSRM
jgi:hypothetical protein